MVRDIIIIAIEVGLLASIFLLMYILGSVVLKALFPAQSKNLSVAGHSTPSRGKAIRYRRQFGLILLLLFMVAAISLVATNSYLIYSEAGVLETQLGLLRAVPREFWQNLGLAIAKCFMLVLLVKGVLRVFVWGSLARVSTFAKNVDSIQANDRSIDQLFQRLARLIAGGLWIFAAIASSLLLQLPTQIVGVAYWVLGVYGAIALGLISIKVIPIAIDTLDALSLRFAETDTPLRFYQKFRYLIPILKQCLELSIYVGVVSLIFRYFAPLAWLSDHTQKIIGVILVYFVTRLAIEVVNVGVDEFVRRNQYASDAKQQRRLTIAPLLKDCLRYVVYFSAIVSILGIVQIDPTPILAGAGIVGLAVGFGAQHFVDDIVSGFLILFENYYLVGDYIAAGRLEDRPLEGIVEAIELRTTKLRHPDGQVQIVRNGEIGSVVNYSKQYIFATVDIPFAQETNLEAVYPIIDAVGQRLKQENATTVIEATQVEGLENLGKRLILVRTITKVKPGQHLHIQRVLRKLLKDAFDQANIELTDYEPSAGSELSRRF